MVWRQLFTLSLDHRAKVIQFADNGRKTKDQTAASFGQNAHGVIPFAGYDYPAHEVKGQADADVTGVYPA